MQTDRSARTLLTIIFVTTIIVLVGGVLLSLQSYEDTRRKAEGRINSLGAVLAEHGERNFSDLEQRILNVTTWLSAQNIKDATELERIGADPRLHELLQQSVKELNGKSGMSLLGADGRLLRNYRDVASLPPISYHDADFFQSLQANPQQGFVLSQPEPGRLSGEMGSQLGHAVLAADGRFIGVVMATLKLELLSQIYRSAAFESSEIVSMFRNDGTLLASSQTGIAAGHVFARPDALQAALRPAAAHEGVDPISGQNSLIAAVALHNQPVTIVISRSTADALGNWQRRSIEAVIIWLVILLANLLLARLIIANRRGQIWQRTLADRLAAQRATSLALQQVNDMALQSGLSFWQATINPDLSVTRDGLSQTLQIPGIGACSPIDILQRLDAVERLKYQAFLVQLRTLDDVTMVLRIASPDPQTYWINVRAHVISRADGAAHCVVCAQDVSAETRSRADQSMQARLAALTDLAGGMAHELNQPLAIIASAAENAGALLDRTPADLVAVQAKLTRIGAQAHRASTLIGHLRDHSKPAPRTLGSVDLADCIRRALGLTQGRMADHGIHVTTDLPPNLPLVAGAEAAITQVLVALLTNAADAVIEARTPTRWIALQANATRDETLLTVADCGGGLDADILDRVFEPFFTTKHPQAGSGLALWMAHTTMQAQHGRITVHNGAEGAVFSLYFQNTLAAVANPG